MGGVWTKCHKFPACITQFYGYFYVKLQNRSMLGPHINVNLGPGVFILLPLCNNMYCIQYQGWGPSHEAVSYMFMFIYRIPEDGRTRSLQFLWKKKGKCYVSAVICQWRHGHRWGNMLFCFNLFWEVLFFKFCYSCTGWHTMSKTYVLDSETAQITVLLGCYLDKWLVLALSQVVHSEK